MASFNKVFLMGNLTRDPQLKYLPNQTAVVEFGIACNRKFKGANGEDREDTTFVEIASFGKQAEVVNQYFTKGKPIFVEGRLKFDTWEDKNGGGKRNKLSVVMEAFQFIGGRDGPGQGGGSGGGYDSSGAQGGGDEYTQQPSRPPARSAPPQRPPAARPPARPLSQPAPEQPFGDDPTIDEADIPF